MAAVAALLLFTAYLVLVVRALGFDEDVDCACFGAFAPGRISRQTVVRNVWLLMLADLAVGISTQGSSPIERIFDGRLPWWWLLGAVAVAVTVALVMPDGPGSIYKPPRGSSLWRRGTTCAPARRRCQ